MIHRRLIPAVLVLFFVLLGVWEISATLSVNQGTLSYGSSTQEKFLGNGTSPTLKQTFTLSADKGYTNLRFEFTPLNGFSQSNLILPTLSTLGPSQQLSVDVQIIIPQDFDAVDDNLDKKKFDIGTLVIKGDNVTEGGTTTDQVSATLALEVKNQLSLEKIELEKEDGTKVDITSSSTVEVTADQDLQFIFHVKNTYVNGTADFDEVTIDMEIEDNGDDSVSLTSLDAGDTDSESIEFNLDDVGNFKVTLLIKGTDEFGGIHGLEKEFDLDINPAPEEPDDSDGDGIADPDDSCSNTPTYCNVGSNGCPSDSDNDGICNEVDSVDNTPVQPEEEETTQPAQTTSTQPQLKTQEKFVPAEPKSESTSSHFLPFLFGFIAGGVIASGFFFLLRS